METAHIFPVFFLSVRCRNAFQPKHCSTGCRC